MAIIKEFREAEEDDWIIFPKKDVRRVADYVVTGRSNWKESVNTEEGLDDLALTDINIDEDYEMIEGELLYVVPKKIEKSSHSRFILWIRLLKIAGLAILGTICVISLTYHWKINHVISNKVGNKAGQIEDDIMIKQLKDVCTNEAALETKHVEKREPKPFLILPHPKIKAKLHIKNGKFPIQRIQSSKAGLVQEMITDVTSEYSIIVQFNEYLHTIKTEMEDLTKLLFSVSESIPKEAVNLVKNLLDSIDLFVKKVASLDIRVASLQLIDKVHILMKQTGNFLLSSRSFYSQAMDNVIHAFLDIKAALEAEINDDINSQTISFRKHDINEIPIMLDWNHLEELFLSSSKLLKDQVYSAFEYVGVGMGEVFQGKL